MIEAWEPFSSLASSSWSDRWPCSTVPILGPSSAAADAGSKTGVTAAFARRSPAAVAVALATVYLVWGSTYLAIRVTDRTMPPLLMSSVRFLVAGAALYLFASRGRARPTLREWGASAIVGAALLLVGNGGVAWAETRLESGLAALALVVTTSAWAGGSLYARGAALPKSPLLAASMQMLAASLFLGVAGLVAGEARGIHADSL